MNDAISAMYGLPQVKKGNHCAVTSNTALKVLVSPGNEITTCTCQGPLIENCTLARYIPFPWDCAATRSIPMSIASMLLSSDTWALVTGCFEAFDNTCIERVAACVIRGGFGLTCKLT